MRHPRKLRPLRAFVAASALALAVTGVALGGVARHAAASKVTVTVTDTRLSVSASGLQSGTTTFVVVNKGSKLHVLSISGPGIPDARTPKVAAGRSATLTVKLRPGSYVLSDPIGLGAYNVRWLQIIPATVVSAKGGSSVVAAPVDPPPMCGSYFTP